MDVPLPAVIHQSAAIPLDTRIVVVGDIHGCFDELQDLLCKVEFDHDQDRLVFVGDLVNKGPKSCEVVRFAREHHVLCVRGNHDDAALSAYYRWKQHPENPVATKYEYVKGFTPEDVEFLASLPFTLTLVHQNTIVVHAGLVPDVPLGQQEPLHMYKMRWLVRSSTDTGDHNSRTWTAAETRPVPSDDHARGDVTIEPWASQWRGPQHVIFGHDAKRGLQQETFASGLDTGCCYGRQLSACILPTREIVSVAACHAYAPMTATST